ADLDVVAGTSRRLPLGRRVVLALDRGDAGVGQPVQRLELQAEARLEALIEVAGARYDQRLAHPMVAVALGRRAVPDERGHRPQQIELGRAVAPHFVPELPG